MHQAESRALRAIQSKRRQQPYRKPTSTAPRPHTKFLSAPSHSFRSFNFKQHKKPSALDMRSVRSLEISLHSQTQTVQL